MRYNTRVWLVGCGIAAQLLTAGCFGGGGGTGGLGSFFGFGGGGSGGDSSGSDSFASFDQGGAGGDAGGDAFGAPSVATVHNPEPASVALFGSGLAGLTLLKRRKARRRSS